eukprot:c19752_g1_i2.p2 GENE.c19752_g1_i2~~c19752_g1_i2.p2  ORF type:complete len:456 (-),score=66.52 c19752_g1_i2:3066-4433(-)
MSTTPASWNSIGLDQQVELKAKIADIQGIKAFKLGLDRFDGNPRGWRRFKSDILAIAEEFGIVQILTGAVTAPVNSQTAEEKLQDQLVIEVNAKFGRIIAHFTRDEAFDIVDGYSHIGIEVWRRLSDRYQSSSVTRVNELQMEVITTRPGTTHEEIGDYLAPTLRAYKELRELGKAPELDLIKLVIERGLPNDYLACLKVDQSLSAANQGTKDLDAFCNLLRQEAFRILGRQPRAIEHQDVPEIALFAKGGRKRQGPNATQHGQGGSKWQFNSNSAQQRDLGGGMRCFNCNQPGHRVKQCPQRIFQGDSGDRRGNKPQNVFGVENIDEEYACMTAVNSFGDKMGDETTSWLFDTGATSNISMCANDFCEIRASRVNEVVLADNSTARCDGEGTVKIAVTDTTGRSRIIVLRRVLFVPSMNRRLLSVHDAIDAGFRRMPLATLSVLESSTTKVLEP